VPPSSATATTIAAASAAVSANNTSQAVPTQAAASSLAPSLTPTLAAIAEKKLQFIFSGQSWVEIRDAHNTIIHSRRHEKGEKTEIDGKPPFQMVIGNASEVKLKYKGKDVDLSETSPAGVARFNLN
jgi:cytoskeleton protein RodZ